MRHQRTAHAAGMLARALTILMLAAAPGQAQSAVPLLVDVAWLAEHAADRDVVLLQVGDRAEYDAQHIAGARFISQSDVAAARDTQPGGLVLEMPSVDQLRATFTELGISDDSHVVLSFGKNASLPSTTRVALALDYIGLGDRTSLLNGGLAAWERAGKPVTRVVPAAARGRLRARPVKPVIVDAAFVASLAQRPNHKLVDARAAVFYKGVEPTYGKSGHIPGATNIPFTQITDDELMIDRERAAALFREAGVTSGDTVVAYCHIGQQATAVIFAARLLGYPVVLYDGAFQDWATANRGPVEK